MKALFPKEGEKIICERKKCGATLTTSADWSEDGMEDFFFCESCMDYRAGRIVKI